MTTTAKNDGARPGSRYKSVRDIAKGLTESPQVLKDFDAKQERTKLVRTLISMRVKASLTQSELAKKLTCTQSKISKLESSEDSNISVQDIINYSVATSFNVSLEFGRPSTLVEKVKNDAMSLKDSLDKLAEIAKSNEEDSKIVGNIQSFFAEATYNLGMILAETASKVPCSKKDHDCLEEGLEFLISCGADAETVLA